MSVRNVRAKVRTREIKGAERKKQSDAGRKQRKGKTAGSDAGSDDNKEDSDANGVLSSKHQQMSKHIIDDKANSD